MAVISDRLQLATRSWWTAHRRRKFTDALLGYLFILPAFLSFAVFILYPTIYSGYLSFMSWNVLNPKMHFIGLENYVELIGDTQFHIAVKNTLLFGLILIPARIVLPLAIALLFERVRRGTVIFRSLFFLPTLFSTVAVSIVWILIYIPTSGLLNSLMQTLGLATRNWLLDPVWALPAVALMDIWKTAGYNVIIFTAGLQNGPTELVEAARIDGAGFWAVLRHITLPLLSPTTYFVFTLAIIDAFQFFTPVAVMTQGKPAGGTSVVVWYLYQMAFAFYRMGYASAIAVVLVIVVVLVTILQNRLVGGRVHYQ